MDAERRRRLESLFDEALKLDPEERPGFAECAGLSDPEVGAELQALLLADARAGSFLQRPLVESLAEGGDGLEARVGRDVGRYRLLRPLGEGSAGRVYLAVRADDEYERRVALKLMRVGLDGDDRRRRFRMERQILAALDHPGIARLYDGGTTDEGEPYFVMEYVEGEPIDAYCERHGLSLAERQELFRSVCAAVHYAHQNLVVHRDIKPGNILVTPQGVPKLLDFGIAKLLNPDLAPPPPAATAAWLRLLTPEYASPEQVQGRPVTTASDVYSLGVLLYKLLTGRLPHRREGGTSDEIERQVRDEGEPLRPSLAVVRPETPEGDDEDRRADRAERRGLARALAGDLDLIVLTALRKEPRRRYGSAAELAADLRRHALGLPVQAHPDTLSYRTRKFCRRHRVGVAAATAFVAAIWCAAALLALQSARLAQERDNARRERDKARVVASFLEEIFEGADPARSRGGAISARTILDRGAARIERLSDQPEIQATLMATIGRIYRDLGVYESAEPLLARALELRRGSGTHGPELAESLRHLGQLHHARGGFERAEALLRASLDQARLAHGPRHRVVASTLGDLGAVRHARGDYAGAERHYREALAILAEAEGTEPPELPEVRNNLASLLFARGRYEEAERLWHAALVTWRRTLGPEHPSTALAVNNLAVLRYAKGDYRGATEGFRESLAVQRRLFGEEHPDVALSLNNLAMLLHLQGEYEEAESLARQALALRRRLFGEAHTSVAESLNNLGTVLRDRGRLDEAEALLGDALRLWRALVGDEHPDVARALNNLAVLQAARGDAVGAESLFRHTLELRRRRLGPGHPDVTRTLVPLGELLTRRGRASEAEPLLREALDARRQRLAPAHPQLAEAQGALGECLGRLGRYAEAEALLLASRRTARMRADRAQVRRADERLAALDLARRGPVRSEERVAAAGVPPSSSPARATRQR